MKNNLVDLDFTNYREHPTNQNYLIFRFPDHERGEYFESLLAEHQIQYEKDTTDDPRNLMLFAINKKFQKKAEYLNHMASAKYRKPFIPHKFFRVLLLLLSLTVLLLAIAGYLFDG